MPKPAISLESLAQLARRAFGKTFVRIETQVFKTRAEKITIFIKELDAKHVNDTWPHKLTYSHEKPGRDPDAVCKHVRTNLRGVIAKRKERRVLGKHADLIMSDDP